MAAAGGEGPAPYEGTGAGGKFRKKPFRRSSQATPYDRPPIPLRNPSSTSGTNSLLSKLVDPASKLIYAGAHRLFGVFRNRLTLPPPERPPEANQEPNDRLGEVVVNLVDRTRAPEQRNNQNENSANMSGAAEISELEKMLKQRSFTRSEMERLTELLRSRTSDVPVEDEGRREEPKVQSSPLNQNRNGSDIFRASVSTPVTNSVVFNEDIASPAELAKAYMGSRPSKVSPSMLGLRNQAPREDSPLLSSGSIFPKSPISLQLSLASKATKGAGVPENGFTTPRSRGRSAIYSMARTPYSRIHSTDSHKGIVSYGGPSSSLTPSVSAREQEGQAGSKQMALKRRSSVLEDDIGSVSPMRRIRQKHNLLSQGGFFSARGREYGSGAAQYPPSSSEKLLLTNEPEHRVQKPVERNGDTTIPFSRYASVPTKSSEMATKILQHLEKMSPKGKPSQSKGAPAEKNSPTKLTPTMLHGQALRSMDTLDSSKFLNNAQGKKSDELCGASLPDVRDSTSQKDKVEENGSKMFAVPRFLLTPVNSDTTVSGKDTGGSVKNAVPPQNRRAFQMSAHEDFLEMDDEIHSNGVASTPVVEKDENLKTSVIRSKDFSCEDASASKSVAFTESKKAAASASIQIADFGTSNGTVVGGEKIALTTSSTPASSTTYKPSVLTESTLTVENFTPPKETSASPSSTISAKTVDKIQPFAFTSAFGTESSGNKRNSWSDAKPESTNSLVNVASVSTNGQGKASVSDKGDDNSTQNAVNGTRKSDTLPSAEAAASKSAVFSFGISAKNTDQNNNEKATDAIGSANSLPSASAATVKSSLFSFGAPAKQSDVNGTLPSSPSSSLSTAPALVSSIFSNQSLNNLSHAGSSTVSSLPSSGIPAGTMTSSGLSTTAATPIFSFGSSMPPATPVSLASTSASVVSTTAGAETTDTKTKNDLGSPFGNSTSSPFGSSSFTSTGSPFRFNSATAPSTAKNQSQGSLFSTGSGSLANAPASAASTQSTPFQFGSTAPSVFGTSGSTSLAPTISPFGSSASSSANPFSSTTASFGQSSASLSSDVVSGAAASAPSIFGSGWQPAKSSVFGSTFSSPSPSTGFSFGASSTSAASTSSAPSMVFGSASTTGGSSGSPFSFGAGASTTPSFPSFSQTQPVFGNSNPFPAPSGNGNGNDQMGMEDSMAEDPMNSPSPAPAPTPSVPAFGQQPSPGFMFGNAAPAPAPALQGVPFQFGGQSNPAAPPNPFQASSSLEFNAGGSFSLGSGGGGGDKSARRMVRVSKNKNRKK